MGDNKKESDPPLVRYDKMFTCPQCGIKSDDFYVEKDNEWGSILCGACGWVFGPSSKPPQEPAKESILTTDPVELKLMAEVYAKLKEIDSPVWTGDNIKVLAGHAALCKARDKIQIGIDVIEKSRLYKKLKKAQPKTGWE